MKFPQAGRLQATVQNHFLKPQLSENKHKVAAVKQEQIQVFTSPNQRNCRLMVLASLIGVLRKRNYPSVIYKTCYMGEGPEMKDIKQIRETRN